MLDKTKFKALFETPQKARLTVICLLVAALTLAAVIVYIIYSLQRPGADVPPSQSEAVSSPPVQSGEPAESEVPPTQILTGIVPALTIDQARELALADAGVAESEAEVTREALAENNGVWMYEFRFRTEAAQYEYKLNANTGEVRSMVKETFVSPGPEVTIPAVPSLPVESPLPEETEAVPPSASPQPSQSPLPAETPAPAGSAAPVPSQSTSLYIGMERAKTIALEHADLTAAEIRFTHTQMRREQGTMVYKIEFRQGRVEYEYKIDAATGRILSHERDAD